MLLKCQREKHLWALAYGMQQGEVWREKVARGLLMSRRKELG